MTINMFVLMNCLTQISLVRAGLPAGMHADAVKPVQQVEDSVL